MRVAPRGRVVEPRRAAHGAARTGTGRRGSPHIAGRVCAWVCGCATGARCAASSVYANTTVRPSILTSCASDVKSNSSSAPLPPPAASLDSAVEEHVKSNSSSAPLPPPLPWLPLWRYDDLRSWNCHRCCRLRRHRPLTMSQN